MINARLRSDFYLAVRHVKEAERICARQQRLIDDLRRTALASEEAEAPLESAASTRAQTERASHSSPAVAAGCKEIEP